MDVNKITLGYWSTKGLGSASRQMIIYAGAPLISKIYRLIPKLENNSLTYDGSEWHEKDKIILKKKNSLINLPYLQFREGAHRGLRPWELRPRGRQHQRGLRQL